MEARRRLRQIRGESDHANFFLCRDLFAALTEGSAGRTTVREGSTTTRLDAEALVDNNI